MSAQPIPTNPVPPNPAPPTTPPSPVAPLVISTLSLPHYGVAGPYSATLTATGGLAPYHWSVRGLPLGLAVSVGGVLSGHSYAVAGQRPVTVAVIDSAGRSASKRLILTVDAYAGQLFSWGENEGGQRGLGNTDTTVVGPKAVALSNVTAVIGSSSNGFAALADGTVWGWGRNQNGQVISASVVTLFPKPVQVPGLADVTTFATGLGTSYALTSHGLVFAWGGGYHGRLGDGSTSTARSGPVQVSGLTDAVSIAATFSDAVAVRADGSVVTWGAGDGMDIADALVPQPVTGLADITSVVSNGGVFLALHADGTVSQWGFGSAPTLVQGLSHVAQLSCGQDNAFALLDDGTIRSWGENNNGGELGDGTTLPRDDVRTVVGVAGAQAISAIAQTTFAELSDGSVMVWGNSGYGDLGNGSEAYAATPVTATWLAGSPFVGSTVASGGGHEAYVAFAIRRTQAVVIISPPPAS